MEEASSTLERLFLKKFQIEELQSKIVELESELENRNNEYCEVLQMDQADREEFSIQTKANLDLAKEKDVSLIII